MDGTVETRPPRRGDGGRAAALDPPTELTPSAHERLVRLAYRFLWNLSDAEDAVQDALAIAHERTDELRDRARWWPWICRIVVSRCHDRGRRKVREARHERIIQRERGEEAIRQSRRVLAADIGERDTLRRFIGRLPRRQREVIVLNHLQRMSFDEIASVLGITASTARVHAKAARESLREMLIADDPECFARMSRRVGDTT